MATVEELVVRIKADASQLERELKRVQGITQQSTTRMSNAFGGLAAQMRQLVPALGAAAVVTFGKRAIDAAGNIVDLSQQIGFAASSLTALEGRLAASGATLDQFAASVNLMNANIGQAVSGNEDLADKFSRLGLSLDDLKTLTPEQQFYAIADALARVETQYEQTELGRAIFGRGFSALIPVIKEGNGALGETVDALKAIDEGLSEETLNRVDAFGDAMSAAAIKARNEFIELFAAVLKVSDFIADSFGAGSPGSLTLARIGTTPQQVEALNRQAAYMEKARAGGFATEATKGTVMEGRAYGPAQPAATPRMQAAAREQAKAIKQVTTAAEEFGVEMERVGEQSVVSARVLKDSFGDALESATFDFENFGDSAANVLEGLARQIARRGFLDPLSDSVGSLIFGSGGAMPRPSPGFVGPMPQDNGFFGDIFGSIGSLFGGFFAEGGRPPLGKVSVVGEDGPEFFVPDSAGTIIPNGGGGGGV
ncbi:MAG TPA: hypothetical protein VD866_27390, partial [Urbifossiella sp.]|nr:hypothetical protein [Urbifossiella sp.]